MALFVEAMGDVGREQIWSAQLGIESVQMFTQCGSVFDCEGDVFAVQRLAAAEVR